MLDTYVWCSGLFLDRILFSMRWSPLIQKVGSYRIQSLFYDILIFKQMKIIHVMITSIQVAVLPVMVLQCVYNYQ
jgi:hypothetical protein